MNKSAIVGLVGVLLICGAIGRAGPLVLFIDARSVLSTLGGTAGLLIAIHGVSTIQTYLLGGLKRIFFPASSPVWGRAEFREAVRIARSAGTISLVCAGISSGVGILLMVGQLDEPSQLAPQVALAMLSCLYAFLLNLCCFVPVARHYTVRIHALTPSPTEPTPRPAPVERPRPTARLSALIGLPVLAGLLGMVIAHHGSPLTFLSLPALLMGPGCALLLVVAIHGRLDTQRYLLGGVARFFVPGRCAAWHEEDHRAAAKLAGSGGRLSLLTGGLGVLGGIVILLGDLADPSRLGPALSGVLLLALVVLILNLFFFLPLARHFGANAARLALDFPASEPIPSSPSAVLPAVRWDRLFGLVGTLAVCGSVMWSTSPPPSGFDLFSPALTVVGTIVLLVATHGLTAVWTYTIGGLRRLFFPQSMKHWTAASDQEAVRLADSGGTIAILLAGSSMLISLVPLQSSLGSPSALGPASASALLSSLYVALGLLVIFVPMSRHFSEQVRQSEANHRADQPPAASLSPQSAQLEPASTPLSSPSGWGITPTVVGSLVLVFSLPWFALFLWATANGPSEAGQDGSGVFGACCGSVVVLGFLLLAWGRYRRRRSGDQIDTVHLG